MDTLVDLLKGDLRYAVRTLLKQPTFTLIAILTLALGIGANSAIFSVVDAVLLKPLPYPNSDRLVRVREKGRKFGFMSTSWPNFQDWSARTDIFEAATVTGGGDFALTGSGDPQQIKGAGVTAPLFDMLGIKPILGRGFLASEDKPGAERVVVISEGLWTRRFGRDPAILERPITLNGRPWRVVGVLPQGFRLIDAQPDVLYSWATIASPARGNHSGESIALLHRGVSIQQAQAMLNTLAATLDRQYPMSNSGLTFHVDPLHDLLVSDVRTALLVILAAVALVLLIACANLANLTLSRMAGRKRELAVRAALGASGRRLVAQSLTESLLLSLLGGAGGLALAWGGVRLLATLRPPGIPFLQHISLDPRVLLFTLAVSIATGVLFGLAPSLEARRMDVNRGLKEGVRGAAGGWKRGRLRRALVIAEVALAVLPAIAAALLIKSFGKIESASPGFEPDNVLSWRISLPGSRYAKPEDAQGFYKRVMEEIGRIPGVEYVGAASWVPFTNSGNWQTVFDVEGLEPGKTQEDKPSAETAIVAGAFFPAMGIALKHGRLFDDTDTAQTPTAVVIDESLAARFWPNQDPLGKRIFIVRAWRQVIGVVQHVKSYGVTEPSRIQVYMSAQQTSANSMTFALRTKARPEEMRAAAARAIAAIDPNLPMFNVRTLTDLVSDSVSRQRFSMQLLTLFAMLAMALSVIGIYGVMSNSVSQRLQEMGIRLALGARPGHVLRMLVGQAMTLVGIGLALGVAAAVGFARVISTLLFGVSAHDLAIFAGVPLLLAVAGLAASLIPAYRATRVDPLICLRAE